MGRLAIAIVLAYAHAAAANPALSLAVEGNGGEVWASRTGWLRDDNVLALRLGIGIGRFTALDVQINEDLDRLEPALGVGARVRPWAGPCWGHYFSPYVRAQASIVAASHLGSNYDLLAGAGHWGDVTPRVPWLHWFAEADVVTRVGEYETVSIRLDLGLAVATSSFWR